MLAASRFLLSALLLVAALALQPLASGGADPAFTDVAATDPAYTAINALAQRGIIKGCDVAAAKFCPDDPTLRAQMAALIARANGWDTADHGNAFTDRCDPTQGCIDADLWRNVGTLQFYDVAKGFDATSYGPHNAVLQQQVLLFISRALVARGAWQRQPDNASIYPNLPRDNPAQQRDAADIVTYVAYVGAAPDTQRDAAWMGYTQPSTRAWFARALWPVVAQYPVGSSPAPNPSSTTTPLPVTPQSTATALPTTATTTTTTATLPAATPAPPTPNRSATPTPIPTAITTPTPNGTATPVPSPSPSQTPGVVPNRNLSVGPGFSDVSPHQLVRTSANILYALVPTCDAYPDCLGTTLRIYCADRSGIPTAFTERDSTSRPAGAGSVAVAIDGQDRLHALWPDRAGRVLYGIFDTNTDRWTLTEIIANTAWTDFGQGDEGVALALDAVGTPHAVWNARGGGGALELRYASRGDGGWTTPVRADDVTLAANHRAWHPTLAFAPDGALLLAWLDGSFNYTADGTIRVRTRATGGIWGASVAIPEAAMTAIDNGPSLIITADGVRHLAFLDTGDVARYWYDAGAGWRGDRQPTRQVTHNPALGPDGQGGVYLYGHGTPQGTIEGHGDDLYRFRLTAGAQAWGAWTLYVRGAYDSSVSTRWSQFFHHFPERVDILYWADPYPNLLFAGSE